MHHRISYRVAADNDGTLWTNNNGTWVPQTYLGSSQPFSATAVSADGSVIIVGTSPGPLFISRDGGSTWTRDASAGSQDWTSLSLSADGTHGLATTSGGDVYSIAVGTKAPSPAPSQAPTNVPSASPTQEPTQVPSVAPTQTPSARPTQAPTQAPTTGSPTVR